MCDCAIHTHSHELARPRRTLQEAQTGSRSKSVRRSENKTKIQKNRENERKAFWTLAVTSQCRTYSLVSTCDAIRAGGTGMVGKSRHGQSFRVRNTQNVRLSGLECARVPATRLSVQGQSQTQISRLAASPVHGVDSRLHLRCTSGHGLRLPALVAL